MELIPVYFIIRAFIEKANEKGLSKINWAIIGVCAYAAGILFFYFLVLPVLRDLGFFIFKGELENYVILACTNIVAGLVAMVVAYQVLGGMRPVRKHPQNPQQ